MHFLFFLTILLYFDANLVRGDTPANCTYEDLRGSWIIHEGLRRNDKTINCSAGVNITSAFFVNLEFPNIATDDDGNVGFWTLIYNQGFELVINNRKYFAFSLYTQNAGNVTNYCSHTFWGWAHETGVNPADWSCYVAAKLDTDQAPKIDKIKENQLIEKLQVKQIFAKNQEFLKAINSKQSNWKAAHYDFMSKKSIKDIIRMAGGKKSRYSKPKPSKISPEIKLKAMSLPDSFDWRNVNGVNFVSPIRNQESCGSCYSFGSLAMHEARLRIKTNNSQLAIFSTQDIVSCSNYSQGCDGGFPYLVAGKYAEDYGLVEDACNPYTGLNDICHTNSSCKRYYATNYRYIGGFYGACNEALMRISLVNNGPIAVSFEVYDDFLSYKSGIYHHTKLRDNVNFGFNPWEITNHVVLIVGYGTENQQDYWIVKNSWGPAWGENGFFRIRRGNDECAIESIAVESDIIV